MIRYYVQKFAYWLIRISEPKTTERDAVAVAIAKVGSDDLTRQFYSVFQLAAKSLGKPGLSSWDDVAELLRKWH